MRILLVEDEEKISRMIQKGLSQHNMIVDWAKDGEEGFFMADVNPYDVILLDLTLPKKDGMSICRDLRQRNVNTPILMLSARDGVKDKIQGLNLGADDYLPKPFVFGELIARIRALMRRERNRKIDLLKVDDLEMNLLTHKVTRNGQKIQLTSKEYTLLEYLMLNANQVVTRTMISEHVWHENFNNMTNVIDVHIKYLRNKIDADFDKKLIHTKRGEGYTLTDESLQPVA